MSRHSNIQSHNQQPHISHQNHPTHSPQYLSEHLHNVTAAAPDKQWVAQFIDGHYYLADPETMKKFKIVQIQIQEENLKLAKLEQDNVSVNNSFLSLKDDKLEKNSNKSFCNTQFNESRHIGKQEEVKNELLQQEDKYRSKIKNMEKQKNELKRTMKLVDSKEVQQMPQGQGPSTQKEQPIIISSQVQKDAISVKKSVKKESVKDKSFQKSQIQKSIRISNQIQQNLGQGSIKQGINVQKSVKASDELQPAKSQIPAVLINEKQPSIKHQSINEKIERGSLQKEPSLKHPSVKGSKQHSIKKPTPIQKDKTEELKSQKSQLQQFSNLLEHKDNDQAVRQDQKSQKIVKSVKKSSKDEIITIKSIKEGKIQQDILSKKSAQVQLAERDVQKSIKLSRHSDFNQSNRISVKEELQSKKQASHIQKSQKSKISSRRSSKQESKQEIKPLQIEDGPVSKALTEKSSKKENLSKKSEIPQQHSIRQIINIEQQNNDKKSAKISHKSSARASTPVKQTSSAGKSYQLDKSVQWSRVQQVGEQSQHINQIKFQQSEKNSSFLVNNEESLNASSHINYVIPNNQLKPEQKESSPQPNMKKKKEIDNQSQKKSKSFIIHSKNGSIKDRSENKYEKNNSMVSSKKSKKQSQFDRPSLSNNESITKEQIVRLHEQIGILQLKLKKVEERQEQMEKLEGTISKIHPNESFENQPEVSKPQSPLDNLAQLSVGLKIQPRLQIQSSIIQVNTSEDNRKKLEKDSQANQKLKLKDQIGRLKKIIRDMQIEKIKSIDHEVELAQSAVIKKIDSKQFSKEGRESRNIEKESLNSIEGMQTQRRFYGSNVKQRLLEDAGKIIKNSNSPQKPFEMTQRRASNQKIKFYGNDDEVVMDAEQIPIQSNAKKTQRNKFYSQVRRHDMIGRLQENEKDFHHFIQSSRVIAEQGNSKAQLQDSNHNQFLSPLASPFNNFSKISVANDHPTNVINYSRLVEQMKKNNPQEEEILPQIHIRDIKVPFIPNAPNAQMSQEQLLNLAKATYKVFGINVDEEDKQLCVKKYKNCVIFTINNQLSECVLWHFSGKFYMGGWKTGEPGQGQKNGEGLEIIPDKHIYKGQFLNGKKNGTGITKLTNGNLYDGQWIEGIKNGRGVYLDAATKVIYSGEWRDGKKDGQGFLKLSEKEYYYGTFVKSIKEGFGVEVFVNGDKYKGQYKNGKFHGKGKYSWSNGSCYEGQFNDGVRHGQGSWKSTKNNGDIYIGTYENDKKNGYGRYVWVNGCMYEGGFSNDVKHGKGRLTYQDGKQIKGVWEEGNLTSTQNEKKQPEHEDQPLRRSVKVSAFGYPSKRN